MPKLNKSREKENKIVLILLEQYIIIFFISAVNLNAKLRSIT
jgi:hypothetical protein